MRKAVYKKGKIALLLLIAIIICDIPSIAYATSTQQKLDEALQEKKNIENELNEHNENLDRLKDNEADLQTDLKSLKDQLSEVSANLESLEMQITQKEQEIDETNAELDAARELEIWQKECMDQRIQYVYEEGEMDYLEILLSSGSFSNFLNSGEYFVALAEYDKKMLDDYEATRILIEEKEMLLQQEMVELDSLRVAAESEKSKVTGLISQTANAVAKNSDQISKVEQEMLEAEEALRRQNDDIEALRRKIEEEIRLSQAAANAAWRDISEVTFADGDRALLAAIIYCEAGGEAYAGKLAVGAVVINRVLSSKYPGTVVGVIYQRSQFSPVGSGRLELALATGKANADCYKAADEAMSGITNVGNCLYFRTPIEGLTGISIGGHIFY